MKLVGTKTVEIARLSLPGDWNERLGRASVKALAADLERTPLLHRPTVRVSDRKVIAGTDRLAALYVSGQRRAEVDMYDATDAEVARARIVENLRRRNDDQDALKAALVDLEEAEAAGVVAAERAEREAQADVVREVAAAEGEELPGELPDNVAQAFPPNPGGNSEKRGRGRPKTERGAARDRAAAAAGVTPEALRRAEQRQRAAKEPKAPGIADFETWGVPVPEALAIAELVGALDSAEQQLRGVASRLGAAVAALTDAPATMLRQQAEVFARLRTRAQEIGQEIRRLRPRATCPFCKGVSGEVENCAGCRGAGYARGDQLTDVPGELRAPGDAAAIYVAGNLTLLADVPAARKRAGKPAPKSGKTLRIETP